MTSYLCGLSILVTGGTGSFGRAFVARALADGARRIVVYSRDEVKQSDMQRDLDDERLRYFLGDVRDADRLEMAMRGIDTVVHAAALKRVEKCEYDPIEAIKTNVGGTTNVIIAALRTSVSKVVGLSSDKASDPINLYGATKLCAERLLLAANNLSGARCRFSAVRYGNVWGSRGSVVPTWAELIRQSKPLRVTDLEATRFFLTQDEAVNLIVSLIGSMKGGELLIPRLPAYRLADLLEAMGGHINDAFITSMPPWEKTHEVLGELSSDRARRMTINELKEALSR